MLQVCMYLPLCEKDPNRVVKLDYSEHIVDSFLTTVIHRLLKLPAILRLPISTGQSAVAISDNQLCIVTHDSALHVGMAPKKNGGSNECISSYTPITRLRSSIQRL